MVHASQLELTPDKIDDYLARGWFRFGGTMRTTRLTVWEERDLRTTLWIRSNLNGFRFSKGNRRVLNRIRKRFSIRRHAFQLDAAHEALYAAYIIEVGGDRPASLTDFLGGDARADYPTREISMWDGDELVAFSLYDEGRDSLMSLLGVFAPLHRNLSLGYASLLLEVELCLETQRSFHYSGYVLPGEPRMDYKLRVGAIEYLDPYEQIWHPWSRFDPIQLPDRRIRERLDQVGRLAARRGLRCRRLLNPLFELAHSTNLDEHMVDQPLLLMVGEPLPPLHLVTWNDEERMFEVMTGVPAVVRHRRSLDGPEHTTATAIVQSSVGSATTPTEVVELIEAGR